MWRALRRRSIAGSSPGQARAAGRTEPGTGRLPAVQPVYLGDHKALVRTVWGQLMVVDTRDLLIAPHLLMDGFWEAWVTSCFRKHVKPGMTVLDVGANVGYYSLLAASIVGRGGKVHAFEPNPDLFALLSNNAHINYFFETIVLNRKAAYSTTATLTFHARKRYQGNSSIGAVPQEHLDRLVDESETIEVEAVALDS